MILKRISAIVVALMATILLADTLEFASPAAAHSPRNWTNQDRSRYCSARAERHANRHVRRTTGAGALTGATVGSIASNSRRNTARNAGRGALIGGGAALVTSNNRWNAYYNRYYRNCMRW